MSTVNLTPTVDVRHAADRFKSSFGWLDSKHSFSFGNHYDHGNTHHGLLMVNNDDIVDAGTGFETHPHRDMEIVTWVLQGSLVHQDSTGHSGVIYPGLAQRMSAGRGILHSEKNDSWRLSGGPEHVDPVHFVQMWVVPDTPGADPGYEQLEIESELLAVLQQPLELEWVAELEVPSWSRRTTFCTARTRFCIIMPTPRPISAMYGATTQ